MPVVVSLLNSLSGIAAAFTGFIIGNNVLIIAGSMVGAAGLILTNIMCKAMNRSIISVMLGGFGGEQSSLQTDDKERNVKSGSADDVSFLMSNADSVIIIPGYGLAVARAQHALQELTEKLIEKFRAKASKASMAQSLIKKIDRIERIQVDKDDNSVMKLHFPVSVRPGKVVIEIEGLSKSYDNDHVLSNINLLIERESKIAFVGQNGEGKSTLAKIIVGELKGSGKLNLGHNVQIGYFAQNQPEYLDGSKTVLDTMIDSANESNRSKVRDILGSFLFKGEDVDKFVKVLSGGERNRLALAKMLLQPFNVLVMDEPTNHLDIKSKNVLKQALQNFDGTLIVVSHDRDFLQGLTSKVYELRIKR